MLYKSEAPRVVRFCFAKKDDTLYVNDGAFGTLFDAAHIEWRFPVAALEDDLTQPLAEFAFYGPTCDDAAPHPVCALRRFSLS